MSFEWSVKMENETEITSESSTEDMDSVSFLMINDDKGRTYRCIANNSVGMGTMCSIEITGKKLIHRIKPQTKFSIPPAYVRCTCTMYMGLLTCENLFFIFSKFKITNVTFSILTYCFAHMLNSDTCILE